MDHAQKTKIYYGIIGFLVLTLVLGLIFSSAAPWNRNRVDLLVRGVDSSAVQEINLGPNNQFLRSNEDWLLQVSGDYIPTRRGAVSGLLEKVFEAQILQDLGKGEDILATSGLDAPKVLSLSNDQGLEILRLSVGNLREDGRGSYVSLGDGPVLWVDQNFPGDFSKTINQWANLSVFDGSFELTDVTQVEFVTPRGLLMEEDVARAFTLTLAETKDQWIGAGALEGQDLDFSQINSKVANLARLSGREVGLSSEGAFASLSHQLIVTTNRGQFTLQLGELEDRGQPIQIDNRRFWVGKFALKDMLVFSE